MEVPKLSEQCDYHIREAEGGWILSYPHSWEEVEGEKVFNYSEKIFTAESDLADFLLKHFQKFKTWRGYEVLEYAQSNSVGNFEIEDVTLPTKENRK